MESLTHVLRLLGGANPGSSWETPGDLAKSLDSRTVQTPALDVIDQKLIEAFNTPDSRLIISMPPQEGKSQRASRRFPLWALTQNPDLRIAIASYEANIARRWGRAIRDDIYQHSDRLNLRVRDDLSAQNEWQLRGSEGGVFTTGVGGALTGRPVDLLIIDDPVKGREQADSPTIREKTWEWWTDTALSRLAPGAPVVIILTRWHSDDLAGRLLAEADSDWVFLNIPAEADHRPEKGEVDVLGRQPGQFMQSARGRTPNQWAARKKSSGPKTWASLYQGRPSPQEGGVFPNEDEWARYSQPMWIERNDGSRIIPGSNRSDQELVQSWDFTFKDTASSDYVVGQVWLRVGTRAYLLDQVRERMNFNQSVMAVRNMRTRWPQSTAIFVEDKANGPAVINALRGQVYGLVPVEPEGSKYARASAVSPLAWSKDLVLPTPELLPGVVDLLEEVKNFPNSPNDDTVDALSQAVNRILLNPLIDQTAFTDQEWADDEWSISPI